MYHKLKMAVNALNLWLPIFPGEEAKSDFIGGEQRLAGNHFQKEKVFNLVLGQNVEYWYSQKVNPLEKVI